MNVGRKSLFYIGEKIIAILISTYLQFGRNCGQKPMYVLDPEDEEIGILDIYLNLDLVCLIEYIDQLFWFYFKGINVLLKKSKKKLSI